MLIYRLGTYLQRGSISKQNSAMMKSAESKGDKACWQAAWGGLQF